MAFPGKGHVEDERDEQQEHHPEPAARRCLLAPAIAAGLLTGRRHGISSKPGVLATTADAPRRIDIQIKYELARILTTFFILGVVRHGIRFSLALVGPFTAAAT